MKSNSKYKAQLKYQKNNKMVLISFEAWKIINIYKMEHNLKSLSEAIIEIAKRSK